MIGLYPLATHPTTFDMATWCVIAKTHGCDHVRFVIDKKIAHHKYAEDWAWRRFGNINVPMCKLAGMSFSVGDECAGRKFSYMYGSVEKAYQQFGRIEKLKSVQPFAEEGYVTITLRESFRNKFRNSNLEAWRRVERTLTDRGMKVMVLKDCEMSPLALEIRMAIYANAAMNLGVSNGPMSLCHFSDAPHITLNWFPKRPDDEPGYDMEALMAQHGFVSGTQFSFAHDRQRNVFKPDTFNNIMEAYDEVMQCKLAA